MTVNQDSICYWTFEFLDKDNNREAPSSVEYIIHDVRSGEDNKVVQDTTTVGSVGETLTVTIEPSDNQIYDDNNEKETRRITLTAIYNSDDQVKAKYYWEVVNLTHTNS